MNRPQDTELQELLRQTELAMPIGSRYAHYLHPEHAYRIDGFVILEATDDIGVIYTAEYGARVPFCRALTVFLEHVAYEGALVPRFRKLS